MDSLSQILSDIRGRPSSSDPIPKILADIRGGNGGTSDSRQKLWSDIRGTGNSHDPIHKIVADYVGHPQSSDSIPIMLARYKNPSVYKDGNIIDPPTNLTLPEISGTLEIGQTLSATTGTWSGYPTYAYQWIQRDENGLNPTDMVGQTSSTCVLDEDDGNKTIQVKITATNGGGSAIAYSAVTGVVPSEGPPSGTNVEKLSQSPSLTVGSQFSVTDGFYVSGFGDARDGFYFYYDEYSGFHRYIHAFPFDNATSPQIRSLDGDQWYWTTNDGDSRNSSDVGASGPFPWLADWSAADTPLTLTHPALQQLQAPSSAVTGEFVADVGVFTKRGTENGKDYYNLVGAADTPAAFAIAWNGSQWRRYGDGGGSVDFSEEDTARPDQATWDQVTPTALTTGQLGAGLRATATYQNQGSALNGRFVYHDVLGGATDYSWDGAQWTNGTRNGVGDTAFPWDADFSGAADPTPGTRDDVANEGNWTTP